MTNVFEKIGRGVETAAVDTEHVVVDIVTWLPRVEKVIASAIKNQPVVKDAILELVKQASTVIGDVTLAAGEKGLDLTTDAKALADAEAFFSWFRTSFIPVVEQVYAEVKADLT